MKLVLASKSPRRIELIRQIEEDVIVRPSDFDESTVSVSDPEALVLALSEGKARAVPRASDEIVIGCDTVVALSGQIFGKPHSVEEARAMMHALSGKTHSVFTGVCVLGEDFCERFFNETQVTFYPLSEEEIEAYIATPEPYDKAGGYGIQERGGLFVREIRGDYNNVIGLPVAALARILAPHRKIS